MRNKLYEIIEATENRDNKIGYFYDTSMLAVFILSLIPLAFKETNNLFNIIDVVTCAVFVVDYTARLVTADYKIKKGLQSFIVYPFTPMAIIDLIAILPSFTLIGSGYKLLKLFRLLRSLRVLRVFKAVRYSKNIRRISEAFSKQKDALGAVFGFAVAYIIVSALIVFNVEPDTFDTFFDALYWAVVSLTTMGYGDIYPVTTAGRAVTMLSAIVGIAIIALPASILTAGYMETFEKENIN